MRNHYTKPVDTLELADCQTIIDLAIQEDAPGGDPTSEAIFEKNRDAVALLVPREPGIFCGKSLAEHLCLRYEALTGYSIAIHSDIEDGHSFEKGQELMRLSGSLRGILRLERPFLNFIQYLSGIATTVQAAVQKAGTGIEILDTRKTLPGYRRLAKYAVYCGGGTNHRINLSDMAMIKDNHILAAGSISSAISRIREEFPDLPVDLEIDELAQLDEALEQSPDVILLDNMDGKQIREATRRIRSHSSAIRIEVSGGWTPEMLQEIGDAGPLGVSMGYITHTTRFLDLSLEMQ
ncbi:MAG: carboxylating nicotinate-nucleotide diphosphorylase [Leptospiraceae bacterium]